MAITDDGANTAMGCVDDAAVAIAKAEIIRRRRYYLLGIATIVMMGIGYVLSPAVVVTLERQHMIPPPLQYSVHVLMSPLEWAYDKSSLVKSFYAAYFELIGVNP